MPNNRKRTVTDDRQLSLFDLIKSDYEERCSGNDPVPGGLNIEDRLRESLYLAIKHCPLSRAEIAAKMSEGLGETISLSMIDSWTSAAKSGHQINAVRISALCAVTRSQEPLRVLADSSGCFVLPGPEVLRAEVQKLSEEILELNREKRRRLAILKEIEET